MNIIIGFFSLVGLFLIYRIIAVIIESQHVRVYNDEEHVVTTNKIRKYRKGSINGDSYYRVPSFVPIWGVKSVTVIDNASLFDPIGPDLIMNENDSSLKKLVTTLILRAKEDKCDVVLFEKFGERHVDAKFMNQDVLVFSYKIPSLIVPDVFTRLKSMTGLIESNDLSGHAFFNIDGDSTRLSVETDKSGKVLNLKLARS